MPFYTRFTLLRHPPAKLRFRNGTVLLETTWDCSQHLPRWIFRARRRVSPGSAAKASAVSASSACALPVVAPIQRAMAADLATCPCAVIATSVFGRKHLEQTLRDGVVLEQGTPEARVMEALVKLGYARSGRATARDL